MGAVANLAPELFAGILADVPFVDALTTILDPSLPLTVIEWDEWGDPLHNADVYAYMKSYSPYENVRADAAYPRILAVTSLNDTRVLYVEPAKWVARLREVGADALLKCEMVAGHGGVSGRYNALAERAFELAWLLDVLGARRRLSPLAAAGPPHLRSLLAEPRVGTSGLQLRRRLPRVRRTVDRRWRSRVHRSAIAQPRRRSPVADSRSAVLAGMLLHAIRPVACVVAIQSHRREPSPRRAVRTRSSRRFARMKRVVGIASTCVGVVLAVAIRLARCSPRATTPAQSRSDGLCARTTELAPAARSARCSRASRPRLD